MEKKPWTLGPWRELSYNVGDNFIRIRGTRLGMRYKIANIYSVNDESSDIEYHSEETKANARLISCAPEMAEALEWAISELDGKTRYDSEDQRSACFEKVYSVLAKIHGAP